MVFVIKNKQTNASVEGEFNLHIKFFKMHLFTENQCRAANIWT